MTLLAHFVEKRIDEAKLTNSTVIGEQSYKASSRDISTAIQYVHEGRSSKPSYLQVGWTTSPPTTFLTRAVTVEMAWNISADECIPEELRPVQKEDGKLK